MRKIRHISLLCGIFTATLGLLTITFPQIASATAPYTCTWTGATNNNFSTATNWSGCNSAAPVATDNDNLVFDNTNLNASKTLNNDITNLQLGSITFSGTSSQFYNYTLTGNTVTISGGVTQNSNVYQTMKLNVTLSGNQSFSGSSTLYIGDFSSVGAQTLALSSYNLTLSFSGSCNSVKIYSTLTGSGNLTDNSNIVTLNADSPNYTGAMAVNSGSSLAANSSQALGSSTSTTTVASGAALDLGFSSDTTFAEPITVSGTGVGSAGAIIASDPVVGVCAGGGGSTTTHTATLSGHVTLLGNTTVNPTQYHNVNITGQLSGSFTITIVPGAVGTLSINSSNNTSNTPNGGQNAPVQTITIPVGDNQPNLFVSVGTNQTYIIDGIRGDIAIMPGGTLKGTGTVGNVYANSGGGTIAPGHSPGCLTVATLDLDSGSNLNEELNGTTACSGYSQLVVNNPNGSSTPILLNNPNLNVIIDNTFKPKAGQQFTIISNPTNKAIVNPNNNAQPGTFNNLPEGATFTVNGVVFKITYKGGAGNDVVLTVISAPAAPNTGFALLRNNPMLTLFVTTITVAGTFALTNVYKRRMMSAK